MAVTNPGPRISSSSLSGNVFLLSCNTVWGNDKWETDQAFSYDSSSTIIACGQVYGGARDGGLTWTGDIPGATSLAVAKAQDENAQAKEYADDTVKLILEVQAKGKKENEA